MFDDAHCAHKTPKGETARMKTTLMTVKQKGVVLMWEILLYIYVSHYRVY